AGLAALLGRLESHGGEAAGELQRELQRTRSMLGALVDLHWADSLYEQLEPKLRLENTLRALRALIYAESLVQAVVVHLEDAHHLDPDSQVLLKQLVHTPARYPVLVLVSGRFCTQEDETCYQLPDEVLLPAVYLHLADLDSAEVQQMAAEILNNGSMRPAALGVDLLNFFLEKTSGNPLFIEALAEELSERDLVWVKNNHWTLKQTRSEEVPAGLNALLITRLDRLDPLMKNAVQTAAVIGREFEPAVLSQMLSAGEEAGLVIARAQQEQIWLDSGSGRQVFRQTLMRDAAYAMQPQARLQSLHAHTARSIELVHTPDLDPHFTDLAFHFSQARDDQQAFYYARQAGEAAAAQYANSQAMYWFQLALDCAGRLPAGSALAEQGAVHTALGELLTTTGQREPAAVHLNQALELFEQTGSREAQAHACRWLARLSENRGEFPQALAWIERGLAILGDQESVETSELLNNAGLIYSRRGDFAAAEHSAGRCLEIARKLGQPKPLARAHNLSGHIARLRGESGAAIEQFSRSLAIYQSAGDLNGQALAHNQLANALIGTGRWQEAGQHFNQARQAFEQIGDTYHRIFVDNNLGWIALNQGDLDLALSYYQGGLAALEETGGSPYVLGTFQMNLGATYVRLGDAAAARQQLATSQATFEKAGARDFLPELHRHLASAALLDGDLPLARRNAEQALQLAREFKMRAEEGCTLRVLGEIESAAGQVQPARRCLQESLEIMGEIGDHYERARSLLALARLAADAHLPEAVIASFKELLPRLQAMGARQEWIEVQSFLHQVEPEWVLPLDKP
ncbi:MAG: ATP-binding protein, partial [Chloroflexota bacterium]